MRDGDLVGRWGGEEFAVILPGVDRRGAVAVLERLRQSLAEAHAGEGPRFTASFGVTDSDAAEDVEQLVQLADAALYTSKGAGRDRITVAEGGTDDVPSEARTNGFGPVSSARPRLPLHEASDEQDPDTSGLEIR
jgi:predicted signal transduction protein with EAL and GGDEF domain